MIFKSLKGDWKMLFGWYRPLFLASWLVWMSWTDPRAHRILNKKRLKIEKSCKKLYITLSNTGKINIILFYLFWTCIARSCKVAICKRGSIRFREIFFESRTLNSTHWVTVFKRSNLFIYRRIRSCFIWFFNRSCRGKYWWKT